MNPLATATLKCGVCGTPKNYANDRMNNIKEADRDAEAARAKEKARMRERIAESARGKCIPRGVDTHEVFVVHIARGLHFPFLVAIGS